MHLPSEQAAKEIVRSAGQLGLDVEQAHGVLKEFKHALKKSVRKAEKPSAFVIKFTMPDINAYEADDPPCGLTKDLDFRPTIPCRSTHTMANPRGQLASSGSRAVESTEPGLPAQMQQMCMMMRGFMNCMQQGMQGMQGQQPEVNINYQSRRKSLQKALPAAPSQLDAAAEDADGSPVSSPVSSYDPVQHTSLVQAAIDARQKEKQKAKEENEKAAAKEENEKAAESPKTAAKAKAQAKGKAKATAKATAKAKAKAVAPKAPAKKRPAADLQEDRKGHEVQRPAIMQPGDQTVKYLGGKLLRNSGGFRAFKFANSVAGRPETKLDRKFNIQTLGEEEAWSRACAYIEEGVDVE